MILANVWPNVAAYTLGKEVMEVLLTGSLPPAAPVAETALPAAEPAPGHLAPYTGYFVAYPGIPAAVDFRGGELWITAAAGEGLALHAPSPMRETGGAVRNLHSPRRKGCGGACRFRYRPTVLHPRGLALPPRVDITCAMAQGDSRSPGFSQASRRALLTGLAF